MSKAYAEFSNKFNNDYNPRKNQVEIDNKQIKKVSEILEGKEDRLVLDRILKAKEYMAKNDNWFSPREKHYLYSMIQSYGKEYQSNQGKRVREDYRKAIYNATNGLEDKILSYESFWKPKNTPEITKPSNESSVTDYVKQQVKENNISIDNYVENQESLGKPANDNNFYQINAKPNKRRWLKRAGLVATAGLMAITTALSPVKSMVKNAFAKEYKISGFGFKEDKKGWLSLNGPELQTYLQKYNKQQEMGNLRCCSAPTQDEMEDQAAREWSRKEVKKPVSEKKTPNPDEDVNIGILDFNGPIFKKRTTFSNPFIFDSRYYAIRTTHGETVTYSFYREGNNVETFELGIGRSDIKFEDPYSLNKILGWKEDSEEDIQTLDNLWSQITGQLGDIPYGNTFRNDNHQRRLLFDVLQGQIEKEKRKKSV